MGCGHGAVNVVNSFTGTQRESHLFSAAAEAMRRILIDSARLKLTRRHGGNCERVSVEECDIAAPEADDLLLAVHEAFDKLALEHHSFTEGDADCQFFREMFISE